MTEDLTPNHRLSLRYGLAWRGAIKIQPTTAIALLVLSALAVIAVSIGVAQADTLSEMMEDESGRLALFGLVAAIVGAGAVTAVMMWLTAPRAEPPEHLRWVRSDNSLCQR